MAEDTSLRTAVAQKLFGATVRAALIAFGAYLFAKWNVTPEQAAAIQGPLGAFADSASALVVAIASILFGLAWSAWEKLTTVKKVEVLKDKADSAEAEAEEARVNLRMVKQREKPIYDPYIKG